MKQISLYLFLLSTIKIKLLEINDCEILHEYGRQKSAEFVTKKLNLPNIIFFFPLFFKTKS